MKSIEDLITYIKTEGTSGAGGIYSISAWLTPEIAQMLLEHNPHNRNLSHFRSQVMAEAMRRGRWQANGTTLTVTDAATLGDGQHRCQAVVLSGISIPVIFVYGVADKVEVLSTIDQPGIRTVGDIIKIARIENAPDNNTLAATNMVMTMTDGIEFRTSDRPDKARFAMEHADQISPWVSWAQQISKESAPINNLKLRGHGTRSVAATPLAVLAYYMVNEGADPDTVQEFYRGVVNPWSLPGDVVRDMTENRRGLLEALNRHVRQCPLNRLNGGNSVVPLMTQYATHIVAYNRYVLDEKVVVVRSMKGKFRYFSDLPPVRSGAKRTAVPSR